MTGRVARAGEAGDGLLRRLAAWAVAAFVFTVPFEEIVTIAGLGSTTRLVGLVAISLGVLALFEGGERVRLRRPTVFVVLLAAYVVWNLATWFWSFEPAATQRTVFTLAQLFAFVWLVTEFCRGRQCLARLMQAFVLGNYVAFGITVYNVLVISGGAFREIGRFNANEFSILLALAIPMAALLLGETRRGWLYALNAAYPVVATFGVVLGASRGGLIVCLVALAVVPFAMAHLGPVRRLSLLVAAVAATWFSFAFAPVLVPDLVRNVERLQGTADELTTGTLTGRTTIWGETLEVFQASPVVGIGAGATRFALAETDLGRVKAVHNAFLSVASGSGLVGLGLLLGLVALAFAGALWAPPELRPFLLVLGLAMLVAMMPANLEARKATWFVWVLMASFRPVSLTWRSETAVVPVRQFPVRKRPYHMSEGA